MNTRKKSCRSWLSAVLVTSTLLAPSAARAQLVTTTTTGASLDLAAPATWDNGVVPNAAGTTTYAPNFDVAGIYTAPSGTVLTWEGVTFSVSGVELKPTSPLTINIGAGGITGSATRLGSTDGYLSINVGATTQTWSAAQGNVGARISGTTSAIINLNSAGTNSFRGDNSGFSGTWKLNTTGCVFQSGATFSMGSAGARVEIANGTSVRLNPGSPQSGHTQEARMIVKGGTTFTVDAGAFVTLLGDLSSATVPGTPASLVVATGTGTANALLLGGDHTGYFGTLTFNRSNSAGFLVYFNEENRQSFTIGANQFAEGVSTASNPVLRAGTGTGSTSLIFTGCFVLDTSAADATAGNTWHLVDQTGLSVSYTPAFYVEGFAADPDGITWRRPENGRTWTYSEATGILTVTAGGTSLPAPPPRDVFFMGGQSNAKQDVASGIIDVMTKSGRFNNPRMVHINHSGRAIRFWYDGAPRQYYDSDFFGVSGTYDQDFLPQGYLQKALTSPDGPHKFRGFFWWQGEADKSLAGVYSSQFLGLANQLATDTGQSIGTGADQWTYHIALPDDLARSYESIRAAQVAMINANPTQGTYYDTRPYPRFTPNDNPHVSEDLDYFVGVEMAKQLIAMRGLPPAELTALNQTLVKTPGDTLSNGSTRKLSRLSGWLPAAIPGPTNILQFTNALTAPVTYDIGGSPDFGNLKIRGLQHQGPFDITITYNSGWGLEIGDAGLEVTSANLVLGSSIVASTNQTWTVASGRSLIANNANAVLDLRNATLTGAGTYDLRAGTYDFGSSPSTGNLSFSAGGQTVKFATASNGGSPGPLGVASDFRSGVGANATFQFTGSGSASWNRNLRFDTAATPGRIATFEVTTPGATFSTSGILGVSITSTTNILNLKLGGAGNLAITGTGGIKTNGTATCNLEKIGTGTLTLSGSDNTFNGPLVITAGKVLVTSTAGVNSSSAITVGSASTTATFEYQGAAGLSRNVTVNSGSTFIYSSPAAMTGQLAAEAGSIVILDGALNAASLTIPANGRLILRGNATFPANLTLVNSGTLDTSTWLGTLPAGFTNNGTLITREDIRTTGFSADGNGRFLITITGRPGHSYQLQTSATLQSTGWSDAGSSVEGSDTPIIFTHTPGVSDPNLFYRVRVSP